MNGGSPPALQFSWRQKAAQVILFQIAVFSARERSLFCGLLDMLPCFVP